jgi:hypothetical protein
MAQPWPNSDERSTSRNDRAATIDGVRRLTLSRTVTAGVALAAAAGCAGSQAGVRVGAPERGLRAKDLRAPDDVTVKGARILPESVSDGRGWGPGPGGATLAIVAGLRVITWPDGAIAAAGDRLPAAPSTVVEVPERMGGGYLFAMDARLWRADTWLGRTQPLLTIAGPIGQVQIGLDRMYVRSVTGVLIALDPQHGALRDLGPLPSTPTHGGMAALDAWRAVAIADLRGAMLTLDAGSTWRPLALPIEPTEVKALSDGIEVGGLDEARQPQWWEVRPDGQVGRLGSAPGAGDDATAPPKVDPSARTFGARPLATAIEDGWPLTDGTALVARDGALGRIRLSDGELLETVADAFPMKPSRCHPVSLARPRDPGAFAFVCGEARGRTVVYRYAAGEGRLVEMRRFDDAREVLGFGNGALAARGACAESASGGEAAGDEAWCLMPPGGAWTEMHFRGDDVDRARVVVLHDGRVALVRPPRGEDLSTTRITLTDGEHSTHVPVVMPAMRADVARALRVGLWMDGFEERRDGVLGGWVDAGGSVAGIEIALDGQATVGSYIRAASDVFVAGRWGLGWTASRRGMETVDGGMTWKDLDVPDPIVPARATRERACGPVGCLAAGWMRVGWGEPEKVTPKTPPKATYVPPRAMPGLQLTCESLDGKPPEPKPAARPRAGLAGIPTAKPAPFGRWGSSGVITIQMPGLTELPPLLAHAAPAMGADDSGVSIELTSSVERTLHISSLAEVYAWGPKSGDWDQLGRWDVRWAWPFGGWPDVRSTASAPAPWTSIDAARRGLQVNTGAANGWTLATGDDADHALLIVRRLVAPTSTDVVALETDRPPLEVRRPGGDPFPDVEAAARVGGRWVLATVQPPGELPATVVWLVDGGVAREVARLPRIGADRRSALRLARRTDGHAVGLVVDGQNEGERAGVTLWIASVDLESGAVGDPEPLAPSDLSDRTVGPCKGDDPGWQVDVPYMGPVMVHVGSKWQAGLQSPLARMRLSRERACVERVVGSVSPYGVVVPEALVRSPGAQVGLPRDARAIDLAVFSGHSRYALRCSVR